MERWIDFSLYWIVWFQELKVGRMHVWETRFMDSYAQ